VYDDAKTVLLTVASSQQRASEGVEAAPSSECAKRIPLLRSPARSSLDARIAISSSTYDMHTDSTHQSHLRVDYITIFLTHLT
jgi:hypothetical protein